MDITRFITPASFDRRKELCMRCKPAVFALLSFLIFACLGTFTKAWAEVIVSGDYQYTASGGKAAILRYTGAETGTLVLPDQLDGNTVTSIGEAAFLGNSFASVVIPAGMTDIKPGVFGSCMNLASIDIAAGNSVYQQADGVLFDKAKSALHTYPAMRPATEYKVPAGVTSIYSGAFFMASQLVSIILPESLKEIGETAFYGCGGLVSVTIPNGTATVGSRAFSMCTSLEAVAFPASVTSIGLNPFELCAGLSSVSVDDANSVYTVVDGVLFDKVQGLLHSYPPALSNERYQVPAGTLAIGSVAFANSRNLVSIQIPDSVSAIGDGAFSGSAELELVVLPRGLTRLEANIFAACPKLREVQMPDSVQVIGAQAFYNCGMLRTVNIPYGVTVIEPYAFAYCSNLFSIIIPGSVVSIGDYAFMGADWLGGVDLSGSVQSIGAYAFSDCSRLTSISIPASVTVIGASAFSSCPSLTARVKNGSYGHIYFYENKLSFTVDDP